MGKRNKDHPNKFKKIIAKKKREHREKKRELMVLEEIQSQVGHIKHRHIERHRKITKQLEIQIKQLEYEMKNYKKSDMNFEYVDMSNRNQRMIKEMLEMQVDKQKTTIKKENFDETKIMGKDFFSKLINYGFPKEQVQMFLETNQFDEEKTLYSLFQWIVSTKLSSLKMKPTMISEDERKQMCGDEHIALSAILRNDYKKLQDGSVIIHCRMIDPNYGKITTHFKMVKQSLYPLEPPIVLVENHDIPEKLKWKIMTEMIREGYKYAGSPMIFALYGWLRDNFEKIVKTYEKKHPKDKKRKEYRDSSSIQKKDWNYFQNKKEEYKPTEIKVHFCKKLSKIEIEKENKKLYELFKEKEKSEKYNTMKAFRQKLPSWGMKEKILDIIQKNQVVIISGETGCGKTTQIPQYILDSMILEGRGGECNIICTQPRRISAVGVSERVAEEIDEKLGKLVGYSIRLDSKYSSETRLLYCTIGVLLRILENDKTLEGVSHVIVDEVHERSVESDFVLVVLKDLIKKRKDLKLILMSATMNAELFSKYFDNCPLLEIQGRSFPVKNLYLEDAIEFCKYKFNIKSPYTRSKKFEPLTKKKEELIETLYKNYSKETRQCLKWIDENKLNYELIVEIIKQIVKTDRDTSGAILVFLPGMQEILKLYRFIVTDKYISQRNSKFTIIPLHSSLSNIMQHKVFDKPPEGVRKIVLATNIAETSITIDDVTYVIDTGKMKEMQFDSVRGISCLTECWISKANSMQRAGRAGRVKAGQCFHLYTKLQESKLSEQPTPEILRTPLEQTILRIKVLNIGQVEDVLSNLIEPPSKESIKYSIERLRALGAMKSDREELTPLGYHLAALPIDVQLGKMIIYGTIFRCLDSILTIAASMGFQSPFIVPFGKQEEATKARALFGIEKSDHLTLLKAYNSWLRARAENKEKEFLFQNFLSGKILRSITDMKKQFVQLLSEIGFIKRGIYAKQIIEKPGSDGIIEATGEKVNQNSNNLNIVKAVICAGLYPNVLYIRESKDGKNISFHTPNNGQVFIHPSSILFRDKHFQNKYIVYHELVRTTKLYVRDATMVSPYSLMLFGGQYYYDKKKSMVILDELTKFKVSKQLAELIKALRDEVDRFLIQKFDHPELEVTEKGEELVQTISQLLASEKSTHQFVESDGTFLPLR